MLDRRLFLMCSAGAALRAAPSVLTPRERVDKVLKGVEPDRPPFTFWYHFGLEKFPGDRHASATLDFHRKFRTDLVKVMSDYPYPKPSGKWYDLREDKNPFPQQIRALELIRDGLAGKVHFVETIFNAWNQAEKISSKEEVLRLKTEKPQALLNALEVIAKSQANHARLAIASGASGVFLAVANAQDGILSRDDYARFSEPFDKMILDAVRTAPLNVLHAHGEKVYLDRFYKGWAFTVLNHSVHGTSIPIADVRRAFPGVLMGGLDERNFRNLDRSAIKQQWLAARHGAGKSYIVAPGCSVPNETKDDELLRVTTMFGA
jgi:uroporphyrinogen decarboxylase